MSASRELEVGGRRVTLTSLEKVLWPETGFTKGDLLDYYAGVAPALLPHVAGRPLTLGRFPSGVDGRGFAQTECRGRPEWLPTRTLPLRTGESRVYCVVDDVPSLLWVVNLNTIELHVFLGRADDLETPAVVAFDLDPGPPANVLDCCAVALALRETLDSLGLRAFPKTSGALGLHVYVPLNAPSSFDQTKAFARGVAERLAADQPDRVVTTANRSARAGKVLVDWLQNDPTRTTVAPYSLRAARRPTISTPVGWEEVEAALAAGRPELLSFGPAEVLDRVERSGDLFRAVLDLAQPSTAAEAEGREPEGVAWPAEDVEPEGG